MATRQTKDRTYGYRTFAQGLGPFKSPGMITGSSACRDRRSARVSRAKSFVPRAVRDQRTVISLVLSSSSPIQGLSVGGPPATVVTGTSLLPITPSPGSANGARGVSHGNGELLFANGQDWTQIVEKSRCMGRKASTEKNNLHSLTRAVLPSEELRGVCPQENRYCKMLSTPMEIPRLTIQPTDYVVCGCACVCLF